MSELGEYSGNNDTLGMVGILGVVDILGIVKGHNLGVVKTSGHVMMPPYGYLGPDLKERPLPNK